MSFDSRRAGEVALVTGAVRGIGPLDLNEEASADTAAMIEQGGGGRHLLTVG